MADLKYHTKDVEALRVRYKNGESAKALAEEYGVSVNRLHSLWCTRGLTVKYPLKNHYAIPVKTLKEVHRKWCAGIPLHELASELAMPRESLKYVLKSAGLKLQRDYASPLAPNSFAFVPMVKRREWYSRAYAMRLNGHTWDEIYALVVKEGYKGKRDSLIKAFSRWLRRNKITEYPAKNLKRYIKPPD